MSKTRWNSKITGEEFFQIGIIWLAKIQISSNIGKVGPHGPRRFNLIFYALPSMDLCTRDRHSNLRLCLEGREVVP
jgi:hypothetical protein